MVQDLQRATPSGTSSAWLLGLMGLSPAHLEYLSSSLRKGNQQAVCAIRGAVFYSGVTLHVSPFSDGDHQLSGQIGGTLPQVTWGVLNYQGMRYGKGLGMNMGNGGTFPLKAAGALAGQAGTA